MRSIAASKLTHNYLERPARANYIATALTIIIVTLSMFWIAFHVGGDRSTTIFTQITYGTSAFLGALWAFQTAYKGHYGPVRLTRQHQLAWLLIGLGLGANLCGRIISIILWLQGREIFPGIPDVFFMLFYPLVLVAILFMPSTRRFRIRICLDALVSTLSFLGAWWFFVIGPAYISRFGPAGSAAELFMFIVMLAFLGWDILLPLTIILFFQHQNQRTLSPSILLVCFALLLNVYGDLAFGYTHIFNIYQAGMLLVDPFRYSSYLLIGLAGLYQYAALARKRYTDIVSLPQGVTSNESSDSKLNSFRQRIFSLLVHIPLTLLLMLTVYGELVRHDLSSNGLVILTAVVGTLVSTRYILASHENEVLLQEREQRHQESEDLRRMMTQLTAILSEGDSE
jgi:hypothetical protein